MPDRNTNPWLVLCLVCIAQFMVILDATIVNVALPSIQADLNLAETDLQWVVNAYTLIFGGFLLLGGRAGDLIGRKRVFLAGVVVFTVASFLNGIADIVDVADPRPRPAGPRRRSHRTRGALDPDDDLRRGPGADEGDGRLGRRSRPAAPRSGCCSAASSSSTSPGHGSSSSTCPVGIAAFLASAEVRARVACRRGAPDLRHSRSDHRHRRPDRARLRDRQRAEVRLDVREHDRLRLASR